MQEELVTSQTAKLAKEKGFDLKVRNWFDISKNPYFEWESSIAKDFNNGKINQVSRPSQCLLQKWLREVHNIHVEPFVVTDVKDLSFTCSVAKGTRLINAIQVKEFDTFEKAFELGLQEALKLIK